MYVVCTCFNITEDVIKDAIPEDAIDMKGAGEEKIISASRLAHGLYPATMKCGRTHHYENWKKDGVKNGAEDYNWELQEVLEL